MKKILWVLLIVLVLTSVAFAGRGNMNVDNRSRGYTRSVVNQEQQEVVGRSKGMGYQNKAQSYNEYVDEDGDGVCDNCDGEGLAPQDGTGNQKGRADARTSVKGMGYQNKAQSCDEYVDEDGDGVCDNCDGEGLAPQDGTGNQKGRDSMDRSPRFGQRGGQTQSQRSGRFFSANNTDEDQELPTGTTPQDGSGNQYGRRGK
ncbi:MAG TPA: hypothetical protein PLN92_07475 [Thermotogota bacterium]|nr:hypothetical protein [Thermotogota bacterium]